MNEDTIRAGADATKEIAVTGGKAIDLTGKIMGYFDGMLREFGGIGEDNMKSRRWENRLRLFDKAQKQLQKRGIDGPTRDIPPKFALPLLTYATLEEVEELQDIWAQMLANAADVSSKVELRTTYIDILKDLTTTDVQILSKIGRLSDSDLPFASPPSIETARLPDHAQVHTDLTTLLGDPSDNVKLSLSNLSRAGVSAKQLDSMACPGSHSYTSPPWGWAYIELAQSRGTDYVWALRSEEGQAGDCGDVRQDYFHLAS